MLFAIYGILFAIYRPGLDDPELAWGIVMGEILPVGILGLLVASFFAAAMSTADTFAITSSAVGVDYLYRKTIRPGKKLKHYLNAARIWAVSSIIIAAFSTYNISSIEDYVKLTLTLLSFLGIPIYFGVIWQRANCTGMWLSLSSGIVTYITVVVANMVQSNFGFVDAINPAFEQAVFISTGVALFFMVIGTLIGKPAATLKVKRFHVILNTPVGREERLVNA